MSEGEEFEVKSFEKVFAKFATLNEEEGAKDRNMGMYDNRSARFSVVEQAIAPANPFWSRPLHYSCSKGRAKNVLQVNGDVRRRLTALWGSILLESKSPLIEEA